MKSKLLLLIAILFTSINSKSQNLFDWDDCGCDLSINLRIHDGLNKDGEAGIFGGEEVSELLEDDSRGAVTVANRNDTDGDTVPDYMDTDGVVQSANGRNELDLMKLIIESTGGAPAQCDQKVRLEASANLKFWKDYLKIFEQTDLEFELSSLPRTIFVEAPEVSNNLRDLEIKAVLGNTEHDIVKATAIWIGEAVKYTTGADPSPDGLVHENLANAIKNREDSESNLYGLGYFENSLGNVYGGRLLMKFELIPSAAKSFNLHFDITRRLNEESGKIVSGNNSFSNTSDDSFLDQVEMPNDDGKDGDEDTFTSNPIFYSYDAPAGRISSNSDSHENTRSYKKWIGDFEEFVRVSLNEFPFSPTGENILGSRCSKVTTWTHGRGLVIRTIEGTSDPYDAPNQHYEVITKPISHSTPTRTLGLGLGAIEIELYDDCDTEGYTINFLNDNKCELRDTNGEVDLATLSNGKWILQSNKIKVTISNNEEEPFTVGNQLKFSTLNNTELFEKIELK